MHFPKLTRAKKKRITTSAILGVIVLAVIAVTVPVWWQFWTKPDILRQHLIAAGPSAPLIIIGYEALQVIIPPLPGEVLDIANGYLFGPLRGAIYSLIGVMAGSAVALWLARQFGRPILAKVFPTLSTRSIHRYLGLKHWWLWVLLLVTPGAPDDAISYLLGLTTIPYGWAMLLIFAGRMPKIIITSYLGSRFSHASPLIILGVSTIIAVTLAWLSRKRSLMDRVMRR